MFHNKANRVRIDAYLRGTLSASDKAAFEQDLKTDGELRKQYNAWVDIMTGFRRQIDDKFRVDFREKGLQMEIDDRNKETIKIFMKVGIVVGIAVAILGIALLPGFFSDNWPFG
jgi:anti-sigma factor RsiW